MDNEPVTAKSLSRTYMIDGGTFEKNYKDVLSDFRTWAQRDHASEWELLGSTGIFRGSTEVKLSKDHQTTIEEVRYIPYPSQACAKPLHSGI